MLVWTQAFSGSSCLYVLFCVILPLPSEMLKQFGAKRFVLPEFSCSSVCVSSVLLHHHKITSIKSRYQVSSLPPVSFYKVLPQIHVVATPISNYQNLVQSTRDTLHCHQLHFIHHCSSERPQKNSLIVKSNKNYRNKIAQEVTMESAEATGDSGTENRLNISHENTDNAEYIKNELKIPQELLDKWEREQLELKKQMILEDSSVITEIMSSCNQNNTSKEFFIGGVDISFVKDDFENACAAFVVLNFPQLEVVYENYEMIKMTAPYIPGFLALREVPFLIDMYNKLKSTHPQFIPHVIMVDGNGILHPREFGLACHLGVLLDTPCIGVAKNLFQVDGILKNKENNEKLTKGGDTYELVGTSGKILGKALRGTCSTNPVYVSTGHRITLDTAVELVYRCCKHRVPEPTRQADLRSREYLRNHFGPDSESKKKGQKKQTTKTKSVKNNKQTVTNCEVNDNVEELLSSCSIFDENKT